MKIRTLSSLMLVIAVPAAVLATEVDRKIEAAAASSYNFKTVLDGHVKAVSADGVVCLTGTVPDKEDRSIAEDTVTDLPGVVSVTNKIVIDPAYPEHSDAWIALRIRGTLLVKANVSASDVTVASQDGVVTLGGKADNLAQKELTEVYAREVTGVKSVKNDIVVGPATPPAETVGQVIDDISISSQVRFALLGHEATSALKTKVTTNTGDITITGVADSDAEKSLVTKLAQDVRGAKSVTNNMTVKS